MSSRRGYVSQAELAEYADVTISNTTEADDQISQAEEQIDNYVGYQNKFFSGKIEGIAQSGTTTSLVLDVDHFQNFNYVDWFKGMMIEIIGGTNAGLRRLITASDASGGITFEAFPSAIDNTSYYKIWQIGKFPRVKDVAVNSNVSPSQYYKSIPEAVKRATAAQVEYMIEMGKKYFSSDKSEMSSESIGDYSYSKKQGSPSGTGLSSMIAPKAKLLLKGITNRTGKIVVDY